MTDKNYYVYFHRRKDDGVVFYIGKGRGSRLTDTRRSKAWIDAIDKHNGFIAEIYKDGLSSKDACDLENSLIANPRKDWDLVNEHQFNSIDYSKNWNDLFYYDETSKSCLRWKSSKYPKRIGKEAGSYHQCGSTGYFNVNVDGRTHKIHRIIWVMFNGEIPDNYVINHINNVSSDNRISNLEVCTYQENAARSKISKAKENNPESYVKETVITSKTDGIIRKYTNFVVSISRDGVNTSRSFSVFKYGRENAYKLAVNYVKTFLEYGKETADNSRNIFYYLDDSAFISVTKDKPLKDGTPVQIVRVNLSSKVLLGNKAISKQFNVSHYSNLEETIKVAKEFRDNKLKECYDNNYSFT